MYRRNKGEKLEDASPGDERRSFLRKAAVTALGGAVATAPGQPQYSRPRGRRARPRSPEPLRLDRARPNYFLVLSNSCSTCQTIGSGLAAPASRWESAITVLVASDSERHGQEWAASVGLDSPRVFVDDQGKYAKQLGVSSSPAVVRVRV